MRACIYIPLKQLSTFILILAVPLNTSVGRVAACEGGGRYEASVVATPFNDSGVRKVGELKQFCYHRFMS